LGRFISWYEINLAVSHGARPSQSARLAAACDEVLATWAQSGERAARDELILRHQGLARRFARRYRGAGIADEDLVQAGVIALIVAVDRYRVERGVRFTTYAAARIHGEIRHVIRDHGWAVRMPRDLQDMSRAAVLERDRLSQRLGRRPTNAEVAAAIGVEPATVAEAFAARDAYWTLPAVDDSDAAALPGRLAADDPELARAEHRAALAAALPRLPASRRRLVHLRFVRGLSQSAIAEELGVSQMQVSRLLSGVLATLHELMADGYTAG